MIQVDKINKPRLENINFGLDVDPHYGEKSWKEVQNPKDLLQNPMDACSKSFSREILSKLGIKNIDSEELEIIEGEISDLVFLVKNDISNALKFKKLKEYIKPYSDLNGDEIKDVLENTEMNLPEVYVQVRQTKNKFWRKKKANFEWVAYDKIKEKSSDWEIFGVRIFDNGSGFDYSSLDSMGSTTKAEDKNQRGGLGEGLRMALLSLKRMGARVHIFSRNKDSEWMITPKTDKAKTFFEGRKRNLNDDYKGDIGKGSGSLVEVVFSKNTKFYEKGSLVNDFDSRKGEGLGKIMLEFRGDEFKYLSHDSCELTTLGLPSGRIYVKGILVQEYVESVFSYNLKEKWSIGGRDRNTTKEEILNPVVIETLQNLNINQIKSFLENIKDNKRFFEKFFLSKLPDLSLEQKELWKKGMDLIFGFKEGDKVVFMGMSHKMSNRRVKRHGYKIIQIVDYDMLNFLQKLYPNDLITFENFNKMLEENNEGGESEIPKKLLERLNIYKSDLVNIFDENLEMIETLKRGFGWNAYKNMKNKIGKLNFSFQESTDKSLKYLMLDPNCNLQIRKKELQKRGDVVKIDIALEILLKSLYKNEFDIKTQDLLTKMMGLALFRRNKDLKKPFEEKFEVSENNSAKLGRSRYPDELRLEDLENIKRYQEEGFVYEENDSDNFVEKIINKNKKFRDKNLSLKTLELGIDLQEIAIEGNGTYLTCPSRGIFKLKFGSSSNEIVLDNRDPKCLIIVDKKGEKIILYENSSFFMYNLGDFSLREGLLFFKPYFRSNLENFLGGIKPYVFKEKTSVKIIEEKLEKIEDENYGKDEIRAGIKLSYGEKVWSDPVRIWSDIASNYLAADKNFERFYTFVNLKTGEIKKDLLKEDTENLSEDFIFIKVDFKDKGKGYPTSYLTGLGRGESSAENIGKFREGLKMTMAAFERYGFFVKSESRNWSATTKRWIKKYLDYSNEKEDGGEEKEDEMLGFEMEWKDSSRKGSVGSFSLLSLDFDSKKLTKDEIEKIKNHENLKIWESWGEVVDPRNKDDLGKSGLDRYILKDNSENKEKDFSMVEVLKEDSMQGKMYEKRVQVKTNSPKSSLALGYNIYTDIINTRERNDYDEDFLKKIISNYLMGLSDVKVIKLLLTRIFENKSVNFLEKKCLENLENPRCKGAWRQAYYEFFGENSILSLGWSNLDLKTKEGKDKLRARANEVHLEGQGLVFLEKISNFFESVGVFTSLDYWRQENEVEDREISEILKGELMVKIKIIHEDLIQKVENMDKSVLKYALNASTRKRLKKRIKSVRNFGSKNLIIKNRTFSTLGQCKTDKRGKMVVLLNEKILKDDFDLVDTYAHEVCHYLSGAGDYTEEFNTFMMAMALE